jgi:hypothetical protein
VWSSALRLLRVDYASPIQEKDPESGYFLFEFPESGKVHPGSVELVKTSEGGVESVRVLITIAALPSYVEQMLLDRLTKKLSQEFGDPTAPPKPPEKQPEKGGDKVDPAAKPGDKPPPAKPKPAP